MLQLENNVRLKKARKISAWLMMFFICSQTAFSQRAFSLRTPSFKMNGDVTIIGNRSLVGGQAGNDDNATNMNNLDLDGDATTVLNSTSADLTLPVGSTVVWAGLYWGGRSANVNRGFIKFKKAGSTYSTYAATQLDDGNTISGITAENHYMGFIDMTNFVIAQGPGTYWGGDVFSTIGNGSSDPYGTGYYGGWAMIVIYTDNTLPYRSITVFDGYSSVWGGNGTGTVTVPISGFLTPSSGPFTTKLGVIAWEGDKNITNDKLRLNVNTDANNVSNATNPATNFFNGTITNTPRNPNTVQNWGVDFDYITSNISLPVNSSSTNVYFNTSGDFYLPGALVFTVDINPVLLPVELLSFDAKRKGAGVTLDWATASESNNDYFEIERSPDGARWTTAGRIAGQGNSNSYQFYEWTDETAEAFIYKENPAAPTLYYRLKQVDFNGMVIYSEPRSVRFESETHTAFNFSIYPNPAKNTAKINFTNANDSAVELKITDVTGKLVYSTQVLPDNFNGLYLDNFKRGTYFIEAKTEDTYVSKRFLVE
ncbi:MAG: T9SS type A sorting domain-containing protein [Bacteroidia bacterium]